MMNAQDECAVGDENGGSERRGSWLDLDNQSLEDVQEQINPAERAHLSSALDTDTGRELVWPDHRPSQPAAVAEQARQSSTVWQPDGDAWVLPELTTEPLAPLKPLTARPRPSISTLSSLDNMLRWREEEAKWRRSVGSLQSRPESTVFEQQGPNFPERVNGSQAIDMAYPAATGLRPPVIVQPGTVRRAPFRHVSAEIGFCLTIAMTQFLTEYLISGFAIELTKLVSTRSMSATHMQSIGIFWPASLLSLILSAMLLFFARVADVYGGYYSFIFSLAWLTIWTLVPGFTQSLVVLDCARAMQGLAIAAFMPSTFTMVGPVYPEGPRRNFVLGLYAGCAPLGFAGGLLVSAALPKESSNWYFWIAAILSGLALVTAFLTVPADRTERRELGLKMDWIGSVLITSGLILVSYALSVEPYASALNWESGFDTISVLAPLLIGIALLVVAFWFEGWHADCPLLPFDFFKPKNVKSLSLACLFFYATYGAWLYNSAQYFQSPTGVIGTAGEGSSIIRLAVWYLPTAIGGVVLCVVGGSLLHRVPIMALLGLSGMAWVAAPLLLALAPLPLEYWSYVAPSMLCATVGIDLTYTVSIVWTTSVQPLRYQGLAGAVCSNLVNLAMAFSLTISEIVSEAAKGSTAATEPNRVENRGFRAAFLYAVVSAGIGLAICVLFVRVRLPDRQKEEKGTDEEASRPTSCDESIRAG